MGDVRMKILFLINDQLRYRHPGFGQATSSTLRGAAGFDPPVSQVHAGSLYFNVLIPNTRFPKTVRVR